MMLCLALRSDPELVYERALRQFSVTEITEGFAAARGLALPSQLRRMLRDQGRDLHAEFVRLLPAPPQPVSIQRWSARRVGLLALVLLLVVFVGGLLANNVSNAVAVETPLGIDKLACTDLEPLWLQAQAVPSASQVPCVRDLPVGWTLAEVAVNDGRSVLTLNHDRAGDAALVVRLTASCDPGGAVEGPSQTKGVRRYQGTESRTGQFTAHLVRPVPGWLRHQPAAPDDRPQRRVRRPGTPGAGVHDPGGAARGTERALRRATATRPSRSAMSRPTSTSIAPSCIEDVLRPGDDHGTYEFGLDLLLDGLGQSLHKQTTH